MTYNEILRMIKIACSNNFYTGGGDIKVTVVKCATKIYIEQMKLEKECETE